MCYADVGIRPTGQGRRSGWTVWAVSTTARPMRSKNWSRYLDSLYQLSVSGSAAVCATQVVNRPAAALPTKLAAAGLFTTDD